MKQVSVLAHPNVALVKYWGKQDEVERIPATPSLSLTLGGLETNTVLHRENSDEIQIDGRSVEDKKILNWLTWLRSECEIPKIKIDSRNNFPSNCGFASSSSGFAALAVGINELCRLHLDTTDLARIARFGSASAVRSLVSGYVVMDPESPECLPVQLAPPEHWQLTVIGAVTSVVSKQISSTTGMARTVSTSPFYQNWVRQTQSDFNQCKQAILNHDFESLRAITEANCYRMHALMMSTNPPLRYWNAGTMNAIATIEILQKQDVPVFFTSDAGPQVKAICLPEAASVVRTALDDTPEVLFTIESDIGNAPSLSIH